MITYIIFYSRRFFESLNFKYWLKEKQKEAENKLELLYLELLCENVINNF